MRQDVSRQPQSPLLEIPYHVVPRTKADSRARRDQSTNLLKDKQPRPNSVAFVPR
jgi:hypothetical protein